MRFLRFAGRVLRLVSMFLAAVVPSILIDAVGIAGALAITYGVWLIYIPAGFVVGGLFMLAISIMLAPRSKT